MTKIVNVIQATRRPFKRIRTFIIQMHARLVVGTIYIIIWLILRTISTNKYIVSWSDFSFTNNIGTSEVPLRCYVICKVITAKQNMKEIAVRSQIICFIWFHTTPEIEVLAHPIFNVGSFSYLRFSGHASSLTFHLFV